MWRAVESTARTFKLEPTTIAIRGAADIESGIAAFAREPDGGLIVLPTPSNAANRDLIVDLAARYRLPAVYPFRYYAAIGGLMSYGLDSVDLFRRSAAYIDRILKGADPGALPVQAPTKFEPVINLKTAKTLGLAIPPTLLARADEVIE